MSSASRSHSKWIVSELRHLGRVGVASYWWKRKAVAKMLGHANSVLTEKTHLPWVKEREEAHLEICDEGLLYRPAAAVKRKAEKLIQ